MPEKWKCESPGGKCASKPKGDAHRSRRQRGALFSSGENGGEREREREREREGEGEREKGGGKKKETESK